MPSATGAWQAIDMEGLAAAARELHRTAPGAFAGEAAAKAALLLALRAYFQRGSRLPATGPAPEAKRLELPIEIRELGDTIRIEERDLESCLGFFEEHTGTVVLKRGLPEVGRHLVLLHELLHAVDAALLAAGITKRRINHGWIESAAPALLAMLVCAGRWRGPAKDEVLRFLAENLADPKAPAPKPPAAMGRRPR
jgi:hypothetical protein